MALGASIVAGKTLVVGATTLSGLATFGISIGSAFGTGALGYAVRTAINSKEIFEANDFFVAACANAMSGLVTFIGSMWRGALGYNIPGQYFSLHNFVLYHIMMLEKGGYLAKLVIALIKKYLQEVS